MFTEITNDLDNNEFILHKTATISQQREKESITIKQNISIQCFENMGRNFVHNYFALSWM